MVEYKGFFYSDDYKMCIGKQISKTKEVVLHPDTEVICKEAFRDNEFIEKAIINCNLEKICECAFMGCKNLKEIEINSPNSVLIEPAVFLDTEIEKFISKSILYYHYDLQLRFNAKHVELTCECTPDYDIFFSEDSKTASAEYVKVKTKKYVFENFICDNDTPNHLCAYPQSRTDKKVYVPDNITVIEDGSFKNNNFLEEVHIGKNLIKVKGSIFDNCENLKTIYIDSDKFVLEEDIFVDCPNIKHVFLNEKVFDKSLPNLSKLPEEDPDFKNR